MIARAYSHVMGAGAKPALTPSGLPILLASLPFDDSTVTPAQAIGRIAAQRFGYVFHAPHWTIQAQYRVSPDAQIAHGSGAKRIDFDRAYILRFDHPTEVAKRKKLGIADHKLDHIRKHSAWWAIPE